MRRYRYRNGCMYSDDRLCGIDEILPRTRNIAVMVKARARKSRREKQSARRGSQRGKSIILCRSSFFLFLSLSFFLFLSSWSFSFFFTVFPFFFSLVSMLTRIVDWPTEWKQILARRSDRYTWPYWSRSSFELALFRGIFNDKVRSTKCGKWRMKNVAMKIIVTEGKHQNLTGISKILQPLFRRRLKILDLIYIDYDVRRMKFVKLYIFVNELQINILFNCKKI